MAKFIPLKNEEVITTNYHTVLKVGKIKRINGANINFACCDCGLVHNVIFVPLKTRMKIYFVRDNRRTANTRRSKKKYNKV